MVEAVTKSDNLLRSPEEAVRLRTVEGLRGDDADSALRCLDEALGDESWRVRKAAVELFREFPDRSRAARCLLRALGDDENAGRRTAAMEALTGLGVEATPFLVEELSHPDEDVRKFVVDIIGEIRDPATVKVLLPLTRDPSENIRLAAVEALGAIGGDGAFQTLLSLAADDEVTLQFSALYALGKIGKPLPLEKIKPLIAKKILRRAVYDALGQTRSAEAVDLLIEGLFDSTKSAKQSAIRALHQLAEAPELKDRVEKKLRERFAGKDFAEFKEFLATDHVKTKQAAARLLALLGTPEAIKLLLQAAHDDAIQPEIEGILSDGLNNGNGPGPELAPSGPRPRRTAKDKAARLDLRALGPLGEELFIKLRDLIARESGLFYDLELKYLLERRVQRRMELLGMSRYQQYLELVEGGGLDGKEELKKLISTLVTNETYFFREDFQLRAFSEELLPALVELKSKGRERKIRIWSAGCSSGEEPYTIAILCRESPYLKNFEVNIIGSDLSERMIARAREGLYGPSSFRAAPDGFQKKHFLPEGDPSRASGSNDKFRIKPEIRQMVSFDSTNLLHCREAPHLAKLDVIFCRNVIIYFSPEAKRRVVDNFYHLLNPGGHLLLGHSESLMSVSTRFELRHLKNDLVYRKPVEAKRSP